MSVYNFKIPLHQKTFRNAILNDISFSQTIKRITKSGVDDIEIEFNSVLSGSESLRLSTMMQSLPINDPDVLIDENMQKITKFTEKLIRDYGKKNTKRGYTESQIIKMTTDLSQITSLLNGKALPTVLGVLTQFTPTSEITSGDISEFINDITNFLGKL